MKKFKILGYSNPITFNSVPIITIIEKNSAISAFFPDGTINKLNIIEKTELKKLKNFMQEKKTKFIYEHEFSYINFHGKIKTNNSRILLQEMKLDLEKLDDKSIHRDMLEELIILETQQLKYQIISNLAKKVLLDVFDDEFKIPINVSQISLKNTISLIENNKMEYEGRIFKDIAKNVNIEYKNINDIAKENFTIAHELGHYFLHFEQHNSFNDTEYNLNDENYIEYAARLDGEARENDMETEASFFAAELLMPDEEVIKFICNKNWEQHIYLTDLTIEMHSYFNVSRNSLILKLRRLKFLEKKDPQQTSETSNLKINKNVLDQFLDKCKR